MDSHDDLSIAVIGMAGRFPGAPDLSRFWSNLRNGVESVRPLTDLELRTSRVPPAMLRRSDYVRAGSFLEGIELFDAAFFGLSVREAELMDPQHRLFMECAWEALETGGYGHPDRPPVGVFASCSTSSYLLNNLYTEEQMVPSVLGLQMLIGNDKDYLATHTSYKLNLKGPSLCVQSACSSSLVAVHLAAQSLLNRECDAALAGGVTVKVPQNAGYLHQDGLILSPDGRTYAFDARAKGTVFGSGVGVVLLRRLTDALRDGDNILAVVRGSAVNNDGSAKVGFTAPSIDGQARVIAEALAVAEVDPETISYVEAHGTGTPLGDPIEITALTRAYRSSTARSNFCALGSVKTNVGHLESAAGIAGFIKAVLCLQHAELPPSVNYERPNPQIDFASTPFFVNREHREWSTGAGPRRAGVSSFGFGGTNCHVVLEEPPARPSRSVSGDGPHLLRISARTSTALTALAARYREALAALPPEIPVADICHTAAKRRTQFEHRLEIAARSREELTRELDRFARGDGAGPSAVGSIPAEGRCVPLPAHPFERERCWIEPARNRSGSRAASPNPLLDQEISLADQPDTRYWSISLGDDRLAFLDDHIVGGKAVFPATGYIEIALAAGRAAFGTACTGVSELTLHRLLPIAGNQAIQISLRAGDGTFRIHSRDDAGSAWHLHASGTLDRAPRETREAVSIDAIRNRCTTSIEPGMYYADLARWGLSYGPAFQAIRHMTRCDGEALARIELPAGVPAGDFEIHPALLDACLHVMGAAIPIEGSAGRRLFVPAESKGIVAPTERLPREVWSHVVVRSGTSESNALDCTVTVLDGAGSVLLKVESLRARSVERSESQPVTASLLYEIRWNQEPLPAAVAPGRDGEVVIAGGVVPASLRARLSASGREVAVSDPAAPLGAGVRDVIYLAAPSEDPMRSFEQTSSDVLALVRSLVSSTHPARLWLITTGAQAADGEILRAGIGAAGLWGLGRVIALEHPELRCVQVDLDPRRPEADGELLAEEILSDTAETQLAFREGRRLVARLARREERPVTAVAFHADATYLITGGLGSLGREVARWMVDRGARNLVLVGRTPGPVELHADARVEVRPLDVSDETAVRQLVADIDEVMPPLRGIIHAAGILDDGVITEQNADRFGAVMRPKLAGAWSLDRALDGRELDFFVMFSSIAGVLGAPGQSNYAAANAAMDSLAHYRRAQGLSAMTVNWGPWAEVGMAAAAGGASRRRWAAQGLSMLPISTGLAALEAAIGQDATQTIVADVDWGQLMRPFPAGSEPPLLKLLVPEISSAAESQFMIELSAAPDRLRRQILENHVRAQAATVLAISVDDVPARTALNDLGLDSLMAIELRSVLSKSLGQTLPATLLFDYPSVEALTNYLSAGLLPVREDVVAADHAVATSLAPRVPEAPADVAIADLSEDEAELLLLKRLESIGR
jgi:acyl transferase domain-containing protein